jgi:NAD(P)-dependent dehydrogenase (short-subunit alcohol dehydrogenase family)
MSNAFSLSGRVFLITGATSGIGYRSVLLLYEMGCIIYAVGRNVERLNLLRDYGKGKIIPIKADLLSDTYVEDITVNLTHQINGFIHCAGVVNSVPLNFVRPKNFENDRRINYDSFVFILQRLIKSGRIEKRSSIVALASIAAHFGSVGHTIYSGNKGALVSTIRVLAKELAVKGIRVNSISPGMVSTEMANEIALRVSNESMALDESKYPLGYGTPLNIAHLIVFLLSDASAWITGQDIVIDGGRTCYV